MALENCKECGHNMSSSARKCPNCGWRRPNMVLRAFLGVIGAGAAWLAIGFAMTPAYELEASERRRVCEEFANGAPYGLQQCAALYHRLMEEGRAAARGSRYSSTDPKPHDGCREEKFSWGTQYVCE